MNFVQTPSACFALHTASAAMFISSDYKCLCMGVCILTTSLYSCCSVFSQAGAPSVFPPITFPLGHGGHGRQQPQHPQLNVLEQDGEFKGRLPVSHFPVDACPDLCLLPVTLGFQSIWNRLHKNQRITKKTAFCNLFETCSNPFIWAPPHPQNVSEEKRPSTCSDW